MAERLKSLLRITAVQKQMVRLAEVRLVAAERACRTLVEDKARLESYVSGEDALGAPLAKAALRSLHTLNDRRHAADFAREAGEATLLRAKQREKAVEAIAREVTTAAQREVEDRALADVVESWMARTGASLR